MNNGTRLLILASQIPILVAVGYQGGWLVWASAVAGGAVLTVAALIIVDSLQRRYRPMTEPNSPREAVEQHRAETSERLMKAAMAEIDNIPGVPQVAPMGEPPTPRLKVGDVVVLRSGGPRMTVYEVRCVSMVDTTWFAGDLLQRDAFAEAELEFAPPKETP